MRRHPLPLDSDSYGLSSDDGPVWWLRGDRQIERAWQPIEREPAIRVGMRRFKLYRNDGPSRIQSA